MHEQYPEDMTIVMQHWFDNLAVMEDRFTVTLNFNNTPEPMVIPFDAVRSFVDPHAEFGLRFDMAEVAGEPQDAAPIKHATDAESEPEDAPPDASVISLDAFRKD